MIDGAPFFQKIILIQFKSSPSTRQRGIYRLLQLQSRYSQHDCAQGVLEPNFIEHDLRKKQEKDGKPSNTGTLVRNTCAQKFVWIRFPNSLWLLGLHLESATEMLWYSGTMQHYATECCDLQKSGPKQASCHEKHLNHYRRLYCHWMQNIHTNGEITNTRDSPRF